MFTCQWVRFQTSKVKEAVVHVSINPAQIKNFEGLQFISKHLVYSVYLEFGRMNLTFKVFFRKPPVELALIDGELERG